MSSIPSSPLLLLLLSLLASVLQLLLLLFYIPSTSILLPSSLLLLRLYILTTSLSFLPLKLYSLNNPPLLLLLINTPYIVYTSRVALSPINPPIFYKNTAIPPIFAKLSSRPNTGARKQLNSNVLLCLYTTIINPLYNRARLAILPLCKGCRGMCLLVGTSNSRLRRSLTLKKLSL